MNKIKEISVSELILPPINAHKKYVGECLPDLLEHIKKFGLLEPLIVCKNSSGKYKILSGVRRFMAMTELGRDLIPCIVVEIEDEIDREALTLGMSLNRLPIPQRDIKDMCNKLFARYNDLEITSKQTGISKYMIKKYVQYARLPKLLKNAVDDGVISSNPKTSLNCALDAVDALEWSPNSDVSEETVLELAIGLSKKEPHHPHPIPKKIICSVIIDKELEQKLNEFAFESGMKTNATISDIIREFLELHFFKD